MFVLFYRQCCHALQSSPYVFQMGREGRVVGGVTNKFKAFNYKFHLLKYQREFLNILYQITHIFNFLEVVFHLNILCKINGAGRLHTFIHTQYLTPLHGPLYS